MLFGFSVGSPVYGIYLPSRAASGSGSEVVAAVVSGVADTGMSVELGAAGCVAGAGESDAADPGPTVQEAGAGGVVLDGETVVVVGVAHVSADPCCDKADGAELVGETGVGAGWAVATAPPPVASSVATTPAVTSARGIRIDGGFDRRGRRSVDMSLLSAGNLTGLLADAPHP